MARLDGAHLIQDLSIVVLASATATLGNFDPPELDAVTGLPPVDDPSSPGPESSWGLRELDHANNPGVTGATMGTRAPGGIGSGHGGSGGSRRRQRDGGSARQPNKNVITRTASSGPKACFAGFLRVQVTKPAPDPTGWTGQRPTFASATGACMPYNPPVVNGPTTALTIGNPNLLTQVETWLATHVGTDAYAVVIEDAIQGPGLSCTADATCTGFSTLNYAGDGVGTVIHAA